MTKQRILIVEDEPSIADNIVYALNSEGFEAQWCATAAAGLAAFAQTAPALLILDIGLPDGSGFEVCKAIRQHSSVPIIFLSARDSEMDKVVGLEIGADDYVVKPFSPRELTARVRARLRSGVAGAAISAAEMASPLGGSGSPILELDREGFSAKLNGLALNLTRYEFCLLAMLQAAPGRVFSREQLLQQIWSDPGAAFDRTVDTHIKTLRQKLKIVDGADLLIRTHRGLGYSFAPASPPSAV